MISYLHTWVVTSLIIFPSDFLCHIEPTCQKLCFYAGGGIPYSLDTMGTNWYFHLLPPPHPLVYQLVPWY